MKRTLATLIDEERAKRLIAQHDPRATLVEEALNVAKEELECTMMTDGRERAIRLINAALATTQKGERWPIEKFRR